MQLARGGPFQGYLLKCFFFSLLKHVISSSARKSFYSHSHIMWVRRSFFFHSFHLCVCVGYKKGAAAAVGPFGSFVSILLMFTPTFVQWGKGLFSRGMNLCRNQDDPFTSFSSSKRKRIMNNRVSAYDNDKENGFGKKAAKQKRPSPWNMATQLCTGRKWWSIRLRSAAVLRSVRRQSTSKWKENGIRTIALCYLGQIKLFKPYVGISCHCAIRVTNI